MRKLIIATGLALGLATVAIAQAPATDRGERGERAERAEQHMAKRLDRMAETLNLTPAQKLQVEAIMAEQHSAQRELHQRYRAEREALREQSQAQMSLVLSAEQQALLEQMRAERKERWKERRHGRHRGADRSGA